CAVQARAGNYLVFFPSYKMLEEIRVIFEAAYTDVRVVSQNPRMTETEREEFLACFSEGNVQSLAGFCVLGGIFGEGIDLRHEKLIGAVIVGTGLPQICNERE
ncbi:helicase C-terminal domain-containing protein, partial [Parabacteroides distasonis]